MNQSNTSKTSSTCREFVGYVLSETLDDEIEMSRHTVEVLQSAEYSDIELVVVVFDSKRQF